MSTAAAEPVVETPKEEKPPETPKAPEAEKKVVAQQRSMVDDIRVVLDGTPLDAPKEAQKVPEEKVTEAEKPKHETTPETPKTEVPKMSENARQSFARIERERDEARQKVETFDAELKTLRAQQEKAAEALKRAEEAERRATELSQQLRTVSLERDPEFIGKYDKPRETRFKNLVELAKSSGVEGDVERALKNGDSERIEEIREALPIHQRAAFDAHFTAIANIDFERQEALKNAEITSKQFEERRNKQLQETSAKYVQENVQAAESTIEELFGLIPQLKDDDELGAQLRSTLHAAAGATEQSANWDTKQILKGIGLSVVQDKVIKVQGACLQQKDEEIKSITEERDKLKKELEERDAFIKTQANGYPRSEHSNGNGAPEEKLGSALGDVRVRLPDGRYIGR